MTDMDGRLVEEEESPLVWAWLGRLASSLIKLHPRDSWLRGLTWSSSRDEALAALRLGEPWRDLQGYTRVDVFRSLFGSKMERRINLTTK